MSFPEYVTEYENCRLCPRHCCVNRNEGIGACGMGSRPVIGRAAPHFWEEPCISGTKGSGAVFFAGCSLSCLFCQNRAISRARTEAGRPDIGTEMSVHELAAAFLKLQEEGVHNINLVTATHFVPEVIRALERAKAAGLKRPVVWNTSGYESVETLRMLDGLVDIYLPDCKYVSAELSSKYSRAADYFEVCQKALAEMVRQVGEPLFVTPEGNELRAKEYNELIVQAEEDDYAGPVMKRGVIVRHLALPGGEADSRRVISYLHETFGDEIYISLMAQYTPTGECKEPVSKELQANEAPKNLTLDLGRRLYQEEYDALVDYCLEIGVQNAFLQGLETAEESFIPEWTKSEQT